MEYYKYTLEIEFDTEDKITKTFLRNLDEEIKYSVEEALFNNNLFLTQQFSYFENKNKNNKLE